MGWEPHVQRSLKQRLPADSSEQGSFGMWGEGSGVRRPAVCTALLSCALLSCACGGKKGPHSPPGTLSNVPETSHWAPGLNFLTYKMERMLPRGTGRWVRKGFGGWEM